MSENTKNPVPPPSLDTPGVVLPTPESFDVADVEKYLQISEIPSGAKMAMLADEFCKSMEPVTKALTKPPAVYSYATFETLPDPNAAAGLIPWPGLPPDTIRKMATTMIAPKIVLNIRQEDVAGFSQLSRHPWKKGWAVEMMDAREHPTSAVLRDIRAAEEFIGNCNGDIDYAHSRERDALNYMDFPTFLDKITCDAFTYGAMAVWTDMDSKGRVKGFSPLPAGNIRLADERGYRNDPDNFAVLVNEGQQVIKVFQRDQLIWSVRNNRNSPDIGNYPWPDLEQATTIVTSFENAMELNADTFTKNGIPNGMILFKGLGFTPRELDLITRLWQNLKKGITKQWALPVMALPPNSEMELVDFSAAKNKDALFQEHLNIVISIYLLICGVPHKRLGFRISGKVPESKDGALEKQAAASAFQEEDTGLTQHLMQIERLVNSYILWTRYPHLRFVFKGKTPREDAREYEVKQLAKVYKERRAEVDLKSLEDIADPELKDVAKIMDLAPCDPGLAGIYQTVASVWLQTKMGMQAGGEESEDGTKPPSKKTPKKDNARFPGTVDGAKKEAHGRTAGTRDSSGSDK